MRAFLFIAAMLTALAGPAAASGLKVLTTGQDSQGWEAVGRLDIAGKRFCTGALIAPDLVLTAAHCLYDNATGARVPATRIEFLAGFRNGRATARARVRSAVVHPGFDPARTDRVARVAQDLALLRLEAPVDNGSVTPFSIGDSPQSGAEVGVVSYAHDRATSPALQELCHVTASQSDILVMTCDVDFGASGAPVFAINAGRAQIVSVVSAKAMKGDARVALGSALHAPLAQLRARLDAADKQIFSNARAASHTLAPSGEATASGARFARP